MLSCKTAFGLDGVGSRNLHPCRPTSPR